MQIANILNTELQKLDIEGSSGSLLRPVSKKLRLVMTFLRNMRDMDELKAFPSWRARPQEGRENYWGVRVASDLRLTFRVDTVRGVLADLDLEETIPSDEKRSASLPMHPGEFVRTEVIQPLDISVTEAANILKMTRPALSAILHGRSSLSLETALRIERAFGVRMDTLAHMQTEYDIAEVRRRTTSVTSNPVAAVA